MEALKMTRLATPGKPWALTVPAASVVKLVLKVVLLKVDQLLSPLIFQ